MNELRNVPDRINTPYTTGETVSFMGATGYITKIDDGPYTLMALYPIEVLLDTGRKVFFTPEGYIYPEFTTEKLVVTGKIKPKVKKWVWVYKVRMSDGYKWITSDIHLSEEAASRVFGLTDHYKILESEIEE